MEKNIRIHTRIGENQAVRFQLKQGVNLYEMLSLTLRQSQAYQAQRSGYGIVVGRVLANKAFGIPNAKVSIFVPLSDADSVRSDIVHYYPYHSVTDRDGSGIAYNLLPMENNSDACFQPVGTFPSKRMVLDNDTVIEIYEKYWKYTTTTNKSGDYMIFGVPTGNYTIHIDIDLSDIGLLSQKPRDLIYKGYNINQFESPSKFKSATDLSSLAQVFSQNEAINVYPFCGDESSDDVAITRKDIDIQYSFETTCVFMGSIVTDNSDNFISQDCVPNANCGIFSQLTTSEGTIEMIRKTPYGNIEEFSIKGNQLIDSNGVWCYQIPMNLDYVGMDEYGNIVPVNDPTKGIPTRTSVRFRITLSENGDELSTHHQARYLVPCNPFLKENEVIPKLYDDYSLEDLYHFGSATPDNCFRDLYWNNVYSVKSYIPRVQSGNKTVTPERTGIKDINIGVTEDKNPFPFNRIRLNNIHREYYRNVANNIWDAYQGNRPPATKEDRWDVMNYSSFGYNTNEIFSSVMNESDSVGLDFYNDWVNGCLYFPLWYFRNRLKKNYNEGEKTFEEKFCECQKQPDKNMNIVLIDSCSIGYDNDDFQYTSDSDDKKRFDLEKETINIKNGIIQLHQNSDGTICYYYSCGTNGENSYVRLFSTDIILLGNLSEYNIFGIPKFNNQMPSSTSNIPPSISVHSTSPKPEDRTSGSSTYDVYESIINGMNWGDTEKTEWNRVKFDTGLFFGVAVRWESYNYGDASHTLVVRTVRKTCVNVERICELGVTNDTQMYLPKNSDEINNTGENKNRRVVDGLITSDEISNSDIRSMFASLNSSRLVGIANDKFTGYKRYNIGYNYQVNFDARLRSFIDGNAVSDYKDDILITENRDNDYLLFRTGGLSSKFWEDEDYDLVYSEFKDSALYQYRSGNKAKKSWNNKDSYYDHFINKRHFYTKNDNKYKFPLYENSFYFFFGLNNGATAMDELKQNFSDDCKVDYSFPFGITYKIERNPTLCGDKGVISWDVKCISSGEVDYNSVKLIMDGFYEVPTDEVDKINHQFSDLDFGNYELYVSDIYGNTQKVYIPLNRIEMAMEFATKNISEPSDTGDTICQEQENPYYGKISISGLYVESEFVTLTDFDFDESILSTSLEDSTFTLDISPIDGLCEIDEETGAKPYDFDYVNKVLTFHIEEEGEYEITLTRECGDNKDTRTFTIKINKEEMEDETSTGQTDEQEVGE